MDVPEEGVDIFGQEAPGEEPAVDPTLDDESEDDEEQEEEEEESGKKGDEEGEGDDDDDGEIDIETEKDPEKLRKALIASQATNKKKSDSIKALRQRRRRDNAAHNAPEGKEFEPPYSKEQTTLVKDLPKEKQEEMTDTEKTMWDDHVGTKIRLNDDAKKRFDADTAAAQKAAEDVDDSIVLDDELEDFAKDAALEIGGSKKVANEILKYFNRYDNTGLSEDEIIERMNDSFKLTKNYQAPKDQQRKRGKAARKSGADAFGNDAIINEVADGRGNKPMDL